MGIADKAQELNVVNNNSQQLPNPAESEDVQPQDDNDAAAGHDSGAENDSDTRSSMPMQKRRRVTRACDECRRKKIKCDGKQPCTHCTVYSYECTYDQPSNRRRNPGPQLLEALEQRLQKAEAVLRSVLPGVDIYDPKFNAQDIEHILESTRALQRGVAPSTQERSDDDAQMRSMIERTGSLDIDDSGYYDYHGHSSGYMFLRQLKSQFGADFVPFSRTAESPSFAHVQESPKSLHSSPLEPGMTVTTDLPPRAVAIELCQNTLDDCCALQRPLHRPTFFRRLNSIYDTEPENYTNEHVKFLPLLYIVMAIGCLFGRFDDKESELDKKGYKFAMEQGYQYFNVGRSMLDITDCRDLISTQAVMFMIIFLQTTAKLATCYAYVGVALRACCRLGMHRKITANFSIVEQEERKRLFWQVRKMDIYVGAMLGLPQMLSDEDIDQDTPSEAVDECIMEGGISPMPKGSFSLHSATSAHTRLLGILQKVVRYVYPIKPVDTSGTPVGGDYTISHRRVRELERDLEQWINELPMELRPSDTADVELARVQQLLRMSYAYVQMMVYRPFLHYVTQACRTCRTDKRMFGCAAACVTVAQNIVHITTDMKKRGLLVGAYWFVMYTTYFAILSLVYYVLENPESETSRNILKDAMEGRNTLANLAVRSMAADRCSSSLSTLFDALPEKLKQRRSSLKPQPSTGKKRPPPSYEPSLFGTQPISNFQPLVPVSEIPTASPIRARTMQQEYLARAAKRASIPDPSSTVESSFPFRTPDSSIFGAAEGTPSDSAGGYSSSHGATPTLDFGTPALISGHLPDLKSVMFPGDNPFAYPAQPMSVLDTMQDTLFGNDSFSPTDQYNTPTSIYQQFNGKSHAHDSFRNQQGMPQHFFGMDGLSDEPEQTQNNQHGGLNISGQDEDHWNHSPATANFRTGLNFSGNNMHVNLDDIFGHSQGWNMPMNMSMGDSIQPPQQQQQGLFNYPGQRQTWQ